MTDDSHLHIPVELFVERNVIEQVREVSGRKPALYVFETLLEIVGTYT